MDNAGWNLPAHGAQKKTTQPFVFIEKVGLQFQVVFRKWFCAAPHPRETNGASLTSVCAKVFYQIKFTPRETALQIIATRANSGDNR